MSKKQTLTVAEIKSLLLALCKLESDKKAKLEARVRQELGYEARTKDPLLTIAENKIEDLVSDVMAHRLKQNQYTVPLFSSQDFAKLIPSIYNEVAKVEGELDAESRKIFENFMRTIFENLSEGIYAVVPNRKNPYREYWRLITAVRDLAAERNISPTELFTLEEEEAADEITRRIFTKKQFVASRKRRLEKSFDAEAMKKAVFQPLLDVTAQSLNEKERQEMKQELETELMPEVRENCEKSKVIASIWLEEEVARIYPRA